MKRFLIYLLFLPILPVFSHGPMEDLIKAKTEEIEKNPTNARLVMERAMLNVQHKNWLDAKSDLQKAESMDPDLIDFNFMYGSIAASRAKDIVAIDYYNKSLAKNPNNFSVLFAKGRAHVSLKEYSLAAKAFDKAFETKHDFQPNHVIEKIQAHQQAGNQNFEEIYEMNKSALDKFGKILALEIELYNLCFKFQKYPQAISALDAIIESVSHKEKWYVEKARCYILTNQKENATQALDEAKKIFAKIPAAIKKRKLIAKLISEASELEKKLIKLD